jgi:lysophospholipid acyltransferase (LPLAT)-like uncharacterized protein
VTPRASAVETESAIPKYTFFQRVSLTLVSWIVPAIVALLGCTLRVRFSFEDRVITAWEEILPGIFPFWHSCVLPAMWIFRKQNFSVMTSRSLDGEYIARVIRRLGYVPIRGSSSRGGQRALLEMASFVENGAGAAFTIDGPRGPRHVAKRGPILLAQATGAAIITFYVAVEKRWELNSWDRFVIPKPFSRAVVRVSRSIRVSQEADEALQEERYREMQSALERITQFAETDFAAAWQSGFAIDTHPSRQ